MSAFYSADPFRGILELRSHYRWPLKKRAAVFVKTFFFFAARNLLKDEGPRVAYLSAAT